MNQEKIRLALQSCMQKVYNTAKEKFILLRSGEKYILGECMIVKSTDGFDVLSNDGVVLYENVDIIEAAIMLCYAHQMDDKSVLIKVKRLSYDYSKHNNDMKLYVMQINKCLKGGDFFKYDVIKSRYTESNEKRVSIRRKLKGMCVNQMLKIKAVDK